MKYLVALFLLIGCTSKKTVDISQFNEYQEACLNLKYEIKHATFKVSIDDEEMKCVGNFKYKTFEYTVHLRLQDVSSHKEVGKYAYLSLNADEFIKHYNSCSHLEGHDKFKCVIPKENDILNRKYGSQ
jgi:hypothetical protein